MKKQHAQVAEMYRRHAANMFRRACTLLGDEAEAHEVLQDIFVSLLERPDQFAGDSSANTYLYSATTHACLNRIRNRRTRERLNSSHSPPKAATPLDAEQQLLLHSALRELPDQVAQVAIYYYVDALTQDEIAQIIGCSRRQVGKILGRLARHRVRKEFSACS